MLKGLLGWRDLILCVPNHLLPCVAASPKASMAQAHTVTHALGTGSVWAWIQTKCPHKRPQRSRAAEHTLPRETQHAWA